MTSTQQPPEPFSGDPVPDPTTDEPTAGDNADVTSDDPTPESFPTDVAQ